jgi:fucose permease
MTTAGVPSGGIRRRRLFFGICLALVPTGASFALVSNILGQLKQEFILTNYEVGLIGGAALWGMAISLLVLGPLLEGYGLKNAARLAFLGHLAGLTLMIAAVTQVGQPSAFWILMIGAATLAVGNGMIEVSGNPLAAALYPGEKTTRLNWFHAFFPIGIIAGGLAGFGMVEWGGPLGYWPYQLAIIYLPILVYGAMVLPLAFPRTENADAGIPVGEMFRYTFTSPLFLLLLATMAITVSIELGPMRWVPDVLGSVGMHGILVLVWISGWMVVLRLLASHFVERLAPTGMLLLASVLTGIGLLLLSVVQGLWSALAVATIFAWGIAFFFPTMVGLVSERLPRTGSLGIVLLCGIGLGTAGAVGVPAMGRVADTHLADALDPAQTIALLERAARDLPAYVATADGDASVAALGYRPSDVHEALGFTEAALARYRETGRIQGDATANALRAILATGLPDEPLVGEAAAILGPAEAYGGQVSFRYAAPLAVVLVAIFGTLYIRDRRQGGYRAVRLEPVPAERAVAERAVGG